MFHAQLKLVFAKNRSYFRSEDLSDHSLEALNRAVDCRMRSLLPEVFVVQVRYWSDTFKWFDYGFDHSVL